LIDKVSIPDGDAEFFEALCWRYVSQ